MRSAWLFVPLLVVFAPLSGCGPKPAPVAVATVGTPTAAPTSSPVDERTDAERASAPRTPTPVATASTAAAATPTPRADSVPVETVIWTAETALDVDPYKIQSKDGVLKKNSPPAVADDAQQRFYPFAIDYWGLKGAKLESLLTPHVGKTIRVKGEYRKIYDAGKWVYEVDPVSITLLPTQ